MRKRTEEEFFNLFCSKSLILNPEGNKEKGRVWMMDFSKEGLSGQLQQRNDPDSGSLRYAREGWKKALADWDSYRRTLPVPPAKGQPVGLFAEKIAEARARMRCVETECRALNEKLREFERQEKEEVQRRSKPRGAIKFLNGRPALCDGRELVTRDDGTIVFKDSPKLTLADYLEQIKKASREKTKLKRKAHNAAVLAEAKQRFGEPGTLEKKKQRRKIAHG